MDSTLMNAWSDRNQDGNEPTPLQDETFRHDMNRWGTTRCDLGMGPSPSNNVPEQFGCGLILDEQAPVLSTWRTPAIPLERGDQVQTSACHEILHDYNFPNHSPEPYIRKPHAAATESFMDISDADQKHEKAHEIEPFPTPAIRVSDNISDHLYRKPVARPSELTIPGESERHPGQIDANFFRGDRFSNYVAKDRCSVTTTGDKHWDVMKSSEGKTAYARMQEPLPDGSGYRITEYRSPFRDSQLLGSCYEVDNEGRVKKSSLETLQLDASLRLARKNLSASVDLNGNLTVTVPGAGRIEDMARTYYRNGTEKDSFVDSSRGASEKISVAAKYRTDSHGQRETGFLRGQSGETELPYMIVTSPASDKPLPLDSKERSVYMYDSFENNYYCTQGEDAGNRFDISVRSRILVRNQRPVVSRCRH